LTIKKRKAKFCFQKANRREICKEKELRKHLSIANKRRITGDKEKQLKAKN
jgi:hypothetical protein